MLLIHLRKTAYLAALLILILPLKGLQNEQDAFLYLKKQESEDTNKLDFSRKEKNLLKRIHASETSDVTVFISDDLLLEEKNKDSILRLAKKYKRHLKKNQKARSTYAMISYKPILKQLLL